MRPRQGFSVMEMVVAAAVFIISVLVLFGIFPISARSVRQAELKQMATHIADSRLKLCRSMAFSDLQSLPPQITPGTFLHQGEEVTEEFSMEQVVTSLNPSLKNVEVIVRWTSERRNQELRLESQFAKLTP